MSSFFAVKIQESFDLGTDDSRRADSNAAELLQLNRTGRTVFFV